MTNLNLADWRPFLGNAVSAGNVNLKLKLSSQQGGKQLGFDLNSQINNLAARFGSNQTFQGAVNLQAQGGATDFKQFNLSDYQLQIVGQNQPLLTVSGSGTYDLPTRVQTRKSRWRLRWPDWAARFRNRTQAFRPAPSN